MAGCLAKAVASRCRLPHLAVTVANCLLVEVLRPKNKVANPSYLVCFRGEALRNLVIVIMGKFVRRNCRGSLALVPLAVTVTIKLGLVIKSRLRPRDRLSVTLTSLFRLTPWCMPGPRIKVNRFIFISELIRFSLLRQGKRAAESVIICCIGTLTIAAVFGILGTGALYRISMQASGGRPRR